MRLALATIGVLLLALLTCVLLRGMNANASAYAETQRAFDDFAPAEASIGCDVLQARSGLPGNYDVPIEAEEVMGSAANRLRLLVETKTLDPKPVDRLAAVVGQYEDLTGRFKRSNSLQNSLFYVSQLSADPVFGSRRDQFAPSATTLVASVLHLARNSSVGNAGPRQQQINRFEARASARGRDGEAAHALLAHAGPQSDLLSEVDRTRALIATLSRQPLEDIREQLPRAQQAPEVTAQQFRVVLFVMSLALLVVALRPVLRLWTRTLKIRRLVDANIIGIFIFGVEGRIIEANDAFLETLGYDREDIISGRLRWTDLTPGECPEHDERCPPPQLKLTGSLRPTEKEYTRKDGSRVRVLVGAAIFEDRREEGVAFVLDLTELKRAEPESGESERRRCEMQMDLAHANRLATMGQITASIAHEVSQPIAATLTNAETALRWLTRQPSNVERAAQAIRCIVQDGRRAAAIVERIRAFIKKAPACREALQINEAIVEVAGFARSEISRNGVSLKMQLTENLSQIEGDRVQLQQVILNLIINAVEAMGQMSDGRRELLISTQTQPGTVLVAVRDSGPGLPEASMDRPFEALYTTKPHGLGMGLSICRSIIEAHGGRLWAARNEPHGAVFCFALPLGQTSFDH